MGRFIRYLVVVFFLSFFYAHGAYSQQVTSKESSPLLELIADADKKEPQELQALLEATLSSSLKIKVEKEVKLKCDYLDFSNSPPIIRYHHASDPSLRKTEVTFDKKNLSTFSFYNPNDNRVKTATFTFDKSSATAIEYVDYSQYLGRTTYRTAIVHRVPPRRKDIYVIEIEEDKKVGVYYVCDPI